MLCHFHNAHKAVTGLKKQNLYIYIGFILLVVCTLYHTLDKQKSMKTLFGHPVSKYWLRLCLTACVYYVRLSIYLYDKNKQRKLYNPLMLLRAAKSSMTTLLKSLSWKLGIGHFQLLSFKYFAK